MPEEHSKNSFHWRGSLRRTLKKMCFLFRRSEMFPFISRLTRFACELTFFSLIPIVLNMKSDVCNLDLLFEFLIIVVIFTLFPASRWMTFPGMWLK